jgi:hypothetical protein
MREKSRERRGEEQDHRLPIANLAIAQKEGEGLRPIPGGSKREASIDPSPSMNRNRTTWVDEGDPRSSGPSSSAARSGGNGQWHSALHCTDLL